jgi:hypothetical protein
MTSMQAAERAPITPLALAGFFTFAMVMSLAAAVSLTTPGTALDGIWDVKPKAHAQLLAMGPWVGYGFAGLGVIAIFGARGALLRRQWGWRLAIIALAVNGLADAARIPFGAVVEGLVGVAVTGTMLWWLTRPRVRALFDR